MKKLPALTSLRFFAAAMIVLIHSNELFGLEWLGGRLALGQGVSFFFVLSGFILTYNYIRDDRKVSWREFYLHRFARLWPAHVVALIFFLCVAAPPLQDIVGTPSRLLSLLANLAMVQAWIPLRQFYYSFNSVSWSISTEVFFYVAFPFMFFRKGKAPWLGVGVSVLTLVFTCLWASLSNAPIDTPNNDVSYVGLLYINPLSRLLEFSVGCFACYIFRARQRETRAHGTAQEVAAILLFAASLWAWKLPVVAHFVGKYFGLPLQIYTSFTGGILPAAVVVYVFAGHRGKISMLLSAKPFVMLGEISFSMYLLHATITRWFSQYPDIYRDHASAYPIYLAVTIVLSAIVYFGIEVPFRSAIIKRRVLEVFRVRRGAVVASICGIVVAASVQLWVPHAAEAAIERKVDAVKAYKSTIYRAAEFNGIVALVAVNLPTRRDQSVEMVWEAKADIPDGLLVGLHLINDAGTLVGNYTVPSNAPKGAKAGQQWVTTIPLDSAPFLQNGPISRVGVMTFLDWHHPFLTTANGADSFGQRFIIEAPSGTFKSTTPQKKAGLPTTRTTKEAVGTFGRG